MSFLKFLGGNVEVTPKAKGGSSAKKERNPVKAEIRIFKNGAVYPSAAAVQKYGLEYNEKDSAIPGNGFDVIDSRRWNVKMSIPALFISPVRRDLPKVDLFGQCGFNPDGSPMVSVLSQGTTTFGEKLLGMIKEVYGVEIPEGQDYIDMLIVEDADLQAALDKQLNGVFHFPKVISRGDKAGQSAYQRRENAKVYGFAPASLFQNSATEGNELLLEESASPALKTSDTEVGQAA